MGDAQSLIRILDVPLNNRYDHTYYFGSKAEQSAFFLNKVIATFSAYTYIRKTWDLQVQTTMEEASNWRYLTFRNSPTGKDYYYFINNIEYVNPSNVRLKLEIDVMQTYLPGIQREDGTKTNDYVLKHCLVERSHTETDVVGENLIDEGLEIGTLINAHTYNVEDLMDLCVLIMTSCSIGGWEDKKFPMATGWMMDRVYTGLNVYAINDDWFTKIGDILSALDESVGSEAIVGMWMYPKALINTLVQGDLESDDFKLGFVSGSKVSTVNLAGWQNYQYSGKLFGGYEPKNMKLYTYPYNYLYVSNNVGGSAEYRYEFFNDSSAMTFDVVGAIAPNAPVKLSPNYYKGSAQEYEEGLSLGAFPTCAWNSDVYKVWLAQNQNQHALTMTNSALTFGSGAVTTAASLWSGNLIGAGAGVMTAYSGINQAQTLLALKKDMQHQPPQARGNFSSSVNVKANKQTFTFYFKTVTAETAEQIDNFFTMYGYKINRVMVPNIHTRPGFTYVKTVGCLIDGKICAEDSAKIMSIFDKGITFWADRDNFGNYSVDNSP